MIPGSAQTTIPAATKIAQQNTVSKPLGRQAVASEINANPTLAGAKDVSKSSVPPNPLSPDSLNSLLSVQSGEQDTAKGRELTEDEKKQVRELKKTDAKVRAHEQAHKSAGGPYAGVVSYQTVTGPDGREYAVAGEVQIDASPIPNNPEATVRKMEVVIRAALAPAEPSPQDMQVAQQAQQTKLQAKNEARKQREAEQEERRQKPNNNFSGQVKSDPAQRNVNNTTGPIAPDTVPRTNDKGLEAVLLLFSG